MSQYDRTAKLLLTWLLTWHLMMKDLREKRNRNQKSSGHDCIKHNFKLIIKMKVFFLKKKPAALNEVMHLVVSCPLQLIDYN